MLDIEEALDRTVWRTRSRRGCGPVVRHYVMMMYQKWTWFSRCALVVALFLGSVGRTRC